MPPRLCCRPLTVPRNGPPNAHTVKLDRTLLDSTREFGSIAIMRAKVGLAHSLGMKVVCCGVADAQDHNIASQAGCSVLQGFLFSTPTLTSTSDHICGGIAAYSGKRVREYS